MKIKGYERGGSLAAYVRLLCEGGSVYKRRVRLLCEGGSVYKRRGSLTTHNHSYCKLHIVENDYIEATF